MLDELLGRASLRERITELESENEHLRARYEAESERRADAVTARQKAEQRVNRLEDRIAQLEGELEERTGGESALSVRRRDRLRGEKLRRILDRLESVRTDPEGSLTVTIDGSVPDSIGSVLGDRTQLAREAAPCLLCVDDEGIVAVTLEHPLVPAIEPTWGDRFELERNWFQPRGRYAIALVRTDLFALGIYDGAERLSYRGFESDVKGSHSKGGFSQARFERIRDDQIDDHVDRCLDKLATIDEERLYLVGQQGIVDAIAESTDPTVTATVDATGTPESALEDAFRSFWTTQLSVL